MSTSKSHETLTYSPNCPCSGINSSSLTLNFFFNLSTSSHAIALSVYSSTLLRFDFNAASCVASFFWSCITLTSSLAASSSARV